MLGVAGQRREVEIIELDLRSRFLLACRIGLVERRSDQPDHNPSGRTVHGRALLILVCAYLAVIPALARSQALNSSEGPSATAEDTTPEKPDMAYVRPTERTKVSNYAFDAFGPYPIAMRRGHGWNQPVDQFSA